MCLVNFGKITKIRKKKAEVILNKRKKIIDLSLIKNPKPGQYVQIKENLAICKIKRNELEKIIDLLEEENIMNRGLVLAASFSYGCLQANALGLTPMLKKYAKSKGKFFSEKEIRKALGKLISYYFYAAIALANNIKDPLDEKVVKAHWIGNELLEKVKLVHLKKVQSREKIDPILFALIMQRPIKEKKFLHHNIYAHQNPFCQVTTDGKYLYHLGERRMKAKPEDIENLKKYGETSPYFY